VAIRGTYPSDWIRYYQAFSYAQRLRTLRDWLARADPAERPRLMTLYFEDVDTRGHDFGPGAPETRAAVREADAAMARLLADAQAIGQPLNLLIVSDHGMARITPPANFVQLDVLLPRDAYVLVNSGAMVEIEPAPGRTAEVERALLPKRPGFQCWRKAELPARFHYGRNPRVPAIVCQSETGWEVVQGESYALHDGGDHGFDPADPSMRALFIAHGPAFARGVTLPDFDNVHLYPLLARVAGVTPLPSDGDAAVLVGALAAR
jgi:predicted AlkP superfamily pyrophosphatase or phosphodiesterase